MTYLGFLVLFLVPPLLVMALLTWRDHRNQRALPAALSAAPPLVTLLAHVAVAVLYTTPWDNYLVATQVWWYDPALVTGITLGWVPLEEYCFFILQTLLSGLWLLFLARRLAHPGPLQPSRSLRWLATAAAGMTWAAAAAILVTGWQPGTYLALILVWALPPIMIQLLFGADILWQQRRLVILALTSTTLYLALADSLAIGVGTWTISPEQSTNLLLANVLPVEEFLFFLLTNTLVVFGMTLVLSAASHERAAGWFPWLKRQRADRQRDPLQAAKR